MVGTLHRQFTELLITATACKLTKKGGKETTRKKLIKSGIGRRFRIRQTACWSNYFRNPELFHPHKWQAHDPTKKQKRARKTIT
jgi:hypothetical protein